MKKINIIAGVICVFGSMTAQRVGIANTNPQAILDVKTASNTATSKSLRVVSSTGTVNMSATDNGFVGFGVDNPGAMVDVKGVDNNYAATKPSFRFYNGNSTPQTLQFYVKPSIALNPAALGSRALIFDNDNDPSTYTGGLYFGTNTSGGYPMGLTMSEKTGIRISYRDGGNDFSQFLYANPSYIPPTLMTGGAADNGIYFYPVSTGTDIPARTAALGGSCTNPGKMVFTGSAFLGCVELANDATTGTWKQLNN